jgi:hypothetical protein
LRRVDIHYTVLTHTVKLWGAIDDKGHTPKAH